MGKVTKRFDNAGNHIGWQHRWRDPGGKQRKKSYVLKSDADAHANKIETSLRDKTYVDPKTGEETFESFAVTWHAGVTGSHNYVLNLASNLRLHVFPVIGDRPMESIDEDDIKELIRALDAKGLKPGTIRLHMTTVRTIFKFAVRKRAIPNNPCEGVSLPKGQADKVQPLEVVQMAALMSNILPRYRALIMLGAATGGRQGELFGIRDRDITWDESAPQVHFKRQLVVEHGNGVVVHPLKNHEDRVIPVPGELLNELGRHIEEFPPSPEGYLFTSPTGKLINSKTFRMRPWLNARKAAAEEFKVASRLYGPGQRMESVRNGVRARQLEEVTMHQLRDYYASLLIHEGHSVAVVAQRLGHADQSTTLRHYSHLWVGHEDRTRETIGENLRQLIPTVP